jgi:hypothetical protein
MTKLAVWLWILAAVLTTGTPTHGQMQNGLSDEKSADIPEDTKLTLDAAPPLQKGILSSILYIQCKKANTKGTAFVIAGGDVISAAHVVVVVMLPILLRRPFGVKL